MNDNTVMWFGQHKGKELANVPASWMMWWYNENPNPVYSNHKKLREYIQANIQSISTEAVFKSY